MAGLGEMINVGGGKWAEVKEDNKGNLYYVNPVSKNRVVVKEATMLDDLMNEMFGAHGAIDKIIKHSKLLERAPQPDEPTYTSSGIIQSMSLPHELERMPPGSRLSGPLDALGEMLAAKLIGQDPETGEIPQQDDPYNPIMNLLGISPQKLKYTHRLLRKKLNR